MAVVILPDSLGRGTQWATNILERHPIVVGSRRQRGMEDTNQSY